VFAFHGRDLNDLGTRRAVMNSALDGHRAVAPGGSGADVAASALGAAAATSQSLVLPRMRGTATATFFLATTLVGLALGPYLAGYVSATNGGDLSKGVLATLWITPIGLALLTAAIWLVPKAAAPIAERARAAGEADRA
jgi:MFS family permease